MWCKNVDRPDLWLGPTLMAGSCSWSDTYLGKGEQMGSNPALSSVTRSPLENAPLILGGVDKMIDA
jgi:hypothetical protein